MTLRLPILSKLLLALTTLAVVAPCQREGTLTPEEQREMRERMAEKRRYEEQEEKMRSEEEREKAELANMTPEERLERSKRRGAAQHCVFAATVKPAKLLPGQSGVLMISALLKGTTVMESPPPIEVVKAVGAAPVEIGTLTAHPASNGTLAQAYLGRPVYDNTAIFEVPVTMSSDVKIGDKHVVAFDVKFDLHDGNTGTVIGRFLDRISAEIEVGHAIDPVVKPPVGVRGDEVETQPEPVAPVEAAPPVEAPVGDDAISGTEPAPMPSLPDAAAPETPESNADPVVPDVGAGGGGLPTPLLLGGGGLLVVIVVLLLARKK